MADQPSGFLRTFPHLCGMSSTYSSFQRPRTSANGTAQRCDRLWLVPAAMLLSLLCSCASGMGNLPPGGPPDSTAPAIVRTVPGNGSVNVSDGTITIEFSEYVEESRVSDQVVITPIPARTPDFDWSGRRLEISFNEPLVENRTYTITFGAGIVDLSGNRLGQPVTLRFSTGPEIDSGRIQGQVIGKTQGTAYIYAYLIPADNPLFADTLRPDSTRPDFIAPIGDDGTFSIEGLPQGRFRLLAVVDEFGDQLFTPGQDTYGVATGDVEVVSATMPVTGIAIRLRSAPDDIVPPDIYGITSISRTQTEIRFSEPIDSTALRRENFTISAGGAAIAITEIWRSAANALAVELAHTALVPGTEATLTLSNIRDTVGNRLPDSSATAPFLVADVHDTLPPTLIPPGIDSLRAYTFPDSIRIGFDEAVRLDTPDAAVSIRDTAGPRAAFRLERISPAEFLARPLDTLFGAARGVLEVNLGRFSDAEGNRRDSIARIALLIGQPRQSGTMEGTIVDSAAPNVSHVVVARATQSGATYTLKGVQSGPWRFEDIPEGEYDISAFRDTDGNGIYDYGSVVPYRPAEAFVIWQGHVRVRPRWATNQITLVFR